MTLFALTLLLAASFIHATWNLLLKRAKGGPAFQWLFAVLSAGLYLPAVLALNWYRPFHLNADVVAVIVGSSLLHTLYYGVLQRGYRVGDLSLVYPLARGTGPFLAVIGAVLILGERPAAGVLAGGLLIILGVFVLSGLGVRSRPDGPDRAAVMYGLATGVVIASYTLWDKNAVSGMSIAPLLLDWGTNCGRSILLAPIAMRRRRELRTAWRDHRREALWVALLNPLAYVLVLTALQMTPVSHIAPAREISILIGSLMGIRLLGEGNPKTRLLGAASMTLGLILVMTHGSLPCSRSE